jgi:hypothetical protein
LIAEMAEIVPRFPVTHCFGVCPRGAQILPSSAVSDRLASSWQYSSARWSRTATRIAGRVTRSYSSLNCGSGSKYSRFGFKYVSTACWRQRKIVRVETSTSHWRRTIWQTRWAVQKSVSKPNCEAGSRGDVPPVLVGQLVELGRAATAWEPPQALGAASGIGSS